VLPVVDGWLLWWEYNKDRYLGLRERVLGGLPADAGGTQTSNSRRPTPADLVDEVIPAIARAMDRTESPDVNGAGLIALGKIGMLHPEIDVPTLLRSRLGRGSMEVRETAALAMGMSGLAEIDDDLFEIAADSGAGRRISARTPVEDRVRAFAIYGMGLAANRSDDSARKQRVLKFASTILTARELEDRDIAAAAVAAIGVLECDPNVASQKRLSWVALTTLEKFLARDLGRGDEVVQAHVPTAIARLLGRGSSTDHLRVIESFTEAIEARKFRQEIIESLILALGEMAVPDADEPVMVAASKVLTETYLSGRQQGARYFALMALARIGGEQNRKFLLREFPRGQKGTERPWLALALGVLAREEMDRGAAVDTTIATVLLESLREIENDDVRSACAVALGLMRFQPAIPVITRLAEKHDRRDQLAGYLCLSLGMIGDRSALPTITRALAKADFQPIVMAQAAIAHALIDPVAAGDVLATLFRERNTSLGRLVGLASAFRYVGDRRAIPALLAMIGDRDTPELSRAFLVAAIGGVSDRNLLPWNEPYARAVNYRALLETLANGVTGILDIL
jgi:HEAT repeat protein